MVDNKAFMNKLTKFKIFDLIILVVIMFTALVFKAANFDYPVTAKIQSHECQSVSDLQNTDVSEIAGMSTYDSRDYGFVTPVRDQGSSNLCWAYSSISASETSILRSGIDSSVNANTLKLSPQNVAYSRHFRGADPLGNTRGEYTGENWLNAAGQPSYCANLFSQWCGPTDSSLSATENQFENGKYRLTNAVHIATDDIYQIKLAIAKYGAITFSYNNVRETEYYNPKLESNSGVAHAVTLVGWDDNIAANKFVPGAASQNGGWIVKNSYNSLPYFYLSYDNKSTAKYAFEFSLKEENENNYFYDSSLTSALSSTINKDCSMFANVFEAKCGTNNLLEYVQAVNVGITNKNVSLKVKIYTNLKDLDNPQSGTLSGEGSSYFDFGGYRTVKLNEPVKVEKGSKFAVVVDVGANTGKAEILFTTIGGKSSMRYKDYWSNVNGTAAIKAITYTANQETPLLSIADSEINIQNGEFVYNGSAITPTVTVKHNGIVLTEKDYTVSYINNINSGTATAIICGIGSYTGGKQITFTINKANNPPIMPSINMKVSNGITELSMIDLPNGWSWLNGSKQLSVGINSDLTAEYFDKNNYKNYQIKITVEREDKEEIKPPIDPNPVEPPDEDDIIKPPTDPVVPPDSEQENPNEEEEKPPITPAEPPVLNRPTDPNDQNIQSDLTALWWLMVIPSLGAIAMVVFLVIKLKK